ncbi:hypothetical protein GCM10011374_41080 [Kocuria dechangensis]|uniref:Uncharacterized protein n=1 Tax=Kocuria dechangensis TaxID=1176249 RepID=A0A917M364_9MICC|nr:hypothetical protein GCM10011374_41080 [Kocuria dechangensis]
MRLGVKLAEAETYLLRVVESPARFRGQDEYNVAAAVQACRQAAGSWELKSLGVVVLWGPACRPPQDH